MLEKVWRKRKKKENKRFMENSVETPLKTGNRTAI